MNHSLELDDELPVLAHCTRSASRNACPEAVIHGQWSAGGRDRQQWPITGHLQLSSRSEN